MSPSPQGGKARCELGSDSFPSFSPHQDAQLGRCQDTSCGLYHVVKEAGGWENFLRLDWWEVGLQERGQRTRQMSLKIQETEQLLGKEGN